MIKRCANLVLGNIASNHRECVATQTFNVTDGRIEYREFKKNFLKVRSVKIGTRNVSHSLFINFMAVPNGRVTVEYCFIPIFERLSQEIHVPNLSEQCFVYGVLTEYAVISGMFNEAKIWSHKFETELFGTNPKYKKLVLR